MIEITDRYDALGIERPNKESCDYCDGTGFLPLEKNTLNTRACESKGGRLMVVGQKEKDDKPSEEDGWVFVVCPECCGSRKKEPKAELKYGGYEFKRI